jgi:hypothetical protein
MWDRRGRGGPIRTGDHLNPIQVRYQAALRPDTRHYTKVRAVWQGVQEVEGQAPWPGNPHGLFPVEFWFLALRIRLNLARQWGGSVFGFRVQGIA